MFAVFLFLTYYLEDTLKFTPIETGAAFLPMIGAVMVMAVFSGSVLLPRTGPRPLVPIGCALAAVGMAMLTGIAASSSYAGSVLPALLVTGLGFGLIFGPVQNAATSGVQAHEAGVASAMVCSWALPYWLPSCSGAGPCRSARMPSPSPRTEHFG